MPTITRTPIYRERSCETCSATFLSRSSKKRFCDNCLRERERHADRERALSKLRLSGARPIGSMVPCAHCGSEFALKAGPEKYCKECSADRSNRWHREKRRADPKKSMSERLSRYINSCLATGKQGKSWRDLVPYTLEELMRHIERQFPPGMTWANRHQWHIDHVVPLSSFEFETSRCPGFKAAWALTNLRPLWKKENQKKSAKRIHLL